jgi:hypothetical protein
MTIPLTITPEQYAAGFIAHDKVTNDMFLVYESKGETCSLWVGCDKGSTQNSNPKTNPLCFKRGVWITDPAGVEVWYENMWCCNTTDCPASLNLDALAEGRVEWI